jgi:hypothetical protein
VPLVRRCRVSLALEHMSQVASAVAANDLCPLHAESAVGVSGYGARHGVKEGRPSAAGLELVLGSVNWCVAAGASICAGGRGVLVVFAGEGRFGTFLTENAELLCRTNISLVHSTKCSLVIDTYPCSTASATPDRSSAQDATSSWILRCERSFLGRESLAWNCEGQFQVLRQLSRKAKELFGVRWRC